MKTLNYFIDLTNGERTTMHWQKTGQDQQTSAAVRYQLWFGLDLSD